MEEHSKTVSSFSPDLKRIKVESPSQTSVSYRNEITSNEICKEKETNVEMSVISTKLEKIKDESPNQSLTSDQNEIPESEKPKEIKRTIEMALNKRVRFLLKCFESMHYLPLKKCISYAETGSKNFLSEFSETREIGYFKNILGICMDENGFLRLKDWHAQTDFCRWRKMRLLSVCILAFEKEMHFKALVSKAIEKSRIEYFQTMSTEDQLNFFKNDISRFFVSEFGFVKLKLKFELPKCSSRSLSTAFENTNQNASQASHMKEQWKTVSLIPPESPSRTFVSYGNEITSNENHKKKETSAEMSSCISSVHPQLEKVKVESTNQTLMNDQNEITASEKPKERKRAVEMSLNKHVRFLLKCFESMHYVHLNKCISYVAMGSRHFLDEFSETGQIAYFKTIPGTFMDENGFLFLNGQRAKTDFCKRRKMRLLTVCILAFEKEMYYKVLVNKALERTGVEYFQSMSTVELFNFFKNDKLFLVSDFGFVKLQPSFKLPECSSRSLSTAFENSKQNASQASNTKEKCKIVSSVLPNVKRIKVESQSQTLVSYGNEITSNDNARQQLACTPKWFCEIKNVL